MSRLGPYKQPSGTGYMPVFRYQPAVGCVARVQLQEVDIPGMIYSQPTMQSTTKPHERIPNHHVRHTPTREGDSRVEDLQSRCNQDTVHNKHMSGFKHGASMAKQTVHWRCKDDHTSGQPCGFRTCPLDRRDRPTSPAIASGSNSNNRGGAYHQVLLGGRTPEPAVRREGKGVFVSGKRHFFDSSPASKQKGKGSGSRVVRNRVGSIRSQRLPISTCSPYGGLEVGDVLEEGRGQEKEEVNAGGPTPDSIVIRIASEMARRQHREDQEADFARMYVEWHTGRFEITTVIALIVSFLVTLISLQFYHQLVGLVFWGAVAFYTFEVALLLCLITSISFMRKTHTFRFVRWKTSIHHEDEARADSIALGELKHKSPRLAVFAYNGVEMVVSCELLSQIATSANITMTDSDKTIFDRLQTKAAGVHSVSISRYLPLMGDPVVQNTVLLAFGISCQMREKMVNTGFPFP